MDRATSTAELLREHRAILDARPDGSSCPTPLLPFQSFLESLSDAQLDALECGAPWPSETPPLLASLVSRARAVCAFPEPNVLPASRAPRRLETPKKSAQVDAFAARLLPLSRAARRVLDVGSGHGHLTRELAERIDRPVVGLERDRGLAERARSLPGAASFAERDVLDQGIPAEPRDLLVGLHACGELGDEIVRTAAERGAAVALLGCCPQKRRDETRVPLCFTEPVLPKRLLGLANLAARDQGVEASRADNLRAREARLALHRLLAARLGPMRFGQEIDGLNRRVAHAGLEVLVTRAFARLSLPLPSQDDIETARREAHEAYGRARRLSLPRAMLARVLEVFVLCDRARFLEERGFVVEVGPVFSDALSPRNLGLFAQPRSFCS